MEGWIQGLGLFAAIVLPLWNIPLIMRIIQRKSSRDLSITWAFGVWICILLMLPSGLTSPDVVWRTFNIINAVLFTVVVGVIVKYHKADPAPSSEKNHG